MKPTKKKLPATETTAPEFSGDALPLDLDRELRYQEEILYSVVWAPELWRFIDDAPPEIFTDDNVRALFETLRERVEAGRRWIPQDDYPHIPQHFLGAYDVQERVARLADIAYMREQRDRGLRLADAASEFNYSLVQELVSKPQPLRFGSSQGRPTYTMGQLADLQFPENPYLMDGVLEHSGITVFAGDVGAGKTYLSLDAMIAMASGQRAWERECKTARSLMFALDNRIPTIKRRCELLCDARGLDMRELDSALTFDWSPITFDDLESMAYIRDRVISENFDAVYFEVLSNYLGKYDENSNSDAGQVFGRLRAIGNETGVAFQLNAHLAKKGSGKQTRDLSDRIRGAGQWLGSADISFVVTREGQGSNITRTLVPRKDREEQESDAQTFSITEHEKGGVVLAFERADPRVRTRTQAEICCGMMLHYAEQNAGQWLLKTDLRDYLIEADMKVCDRTFQSALKLFQEKANIERGSAGKFATFTFINADS